MSITFGINITDAPYGAVGDGVTDDHSAIQSAITNNLGKTIIFPKPSASYKLGSNVTMPALVNLEFEEGVTFSGTGSMPGAPTNSAQKLSQNYISSAVSGGTANVGTQSLAVEISPALNYAGNAVALYAGVNTPSSAGTFSGEVWSFNTVTTITQQSPI